MLNYLNAHVIYPLAERRLKRDITSKLNVLNQDYLLNKKARAERQKKQIFQILETAQHKVPYYRELFKELHFKPEAVLHDIRALEALPYLTKEIIREQGSRLLNEDFKMPELHVRKTGGSTGITTLIYYDHSALDWTAAVNLFVQSFTGRKHSDKEAHLSTHFFQKMPIKDRWIEWVKCQAMNRVNLFTHAFSEAELSDLWEKIRKIRPYLIQGHPSTLYALSKRVESTKAFDKGAIRVFESTGESIDEKKIKSIEEQLGCKVFNRYGTAEFGVTAHSREQANELEIIDYIVYHETVSLGNGLEEIVGTTTTNRAMPLIRYRSGDVGEIKHTENRDYLIHLQGRVHDLIEINGKSYPTHYLQDVLDRVGGVEEFQIVQKKDGSQTLNLVLENQEKREALQKRVQELFGDAFTVKFIKFEQLIRIGWRDKFRYLIKESS